MATPGTPAPPAPPTTTTPSSTPTATATTTAAIAPSPSPAAAAITSLPRVEKLRRVTAFLPCTKPVEGADGKPQRCTCDGWKKPAQSSSSSGEGESEAQTAPPSAQTLQHQQLFQQRILLHKLLTQAQTPEQQQPLQLQIQKIEQRLQQLDPAQRLALRQALTKQLDDMCSTCRHSITWHGDLGSLPEEVLNVKFSIAMQLEMQMAELTKSDDPSVRAKVASNVLMLKQRLMTPPPKRTVMSPSLTPIAQSQSVGATSTPTPSIAATTLAPALAAATFKATPQHQQQQQQLLLQQQQQHLQQLQQQQQQAAQSLSRANMLADFKKKQMTAIQAFRAYLARTPPFEKPVIAEIIKNFILLRYGKKTGEGRKRMTDKLFKRLMTAMTRMELPDPKKHKAKFPNDNLYPLNYRRWLTYCKGEEGSANKPSYKLAESFGRTMLLSITPTLREYVMTNMNLPSDMDNFTATFFKDFEKEIANEYSLVFLELFADHHARLKEMEERILHEEIEKEERLARKRSLADPSESSSSKKPKIESADSSTSTSSSSSSSSSSRVKTEEPAVDAPIPELAVQAKERTATVEDREGLIDAVCVYNDRTHDSLVKLTRLKEIISLQLPNMSKDYITRLVFDRNHKSVCLQRDSRVIGGICYRLFQQQGFIEIVFLAIIADEQGKGYGTRVMDYLKRQMQIDRVYYGLTYADNFATGYFKKQGFTKGTVLPRERWAGYIKDYDGATLMQVHIHPTIDYLRITEIIKQQKALITAKVRERTTSHMRHAGLKLFSQGERRAAIADIPGIGTSRWENNVDEAQIQSFQPMFRDLLNQLKNHNDAWPFLEPVDREAVPDYYVVIKNPIDLSTIEQRLDDGFYITKELFFADLRRMFDNCRTYNSEESVFYRCGATLQRYVADRGGAPYFK